MSRKKRSEAAERQRVPVDARTARRKVSTWLVRDVGNLLMGGEPEYVPGERPVWRVPVVATYGCQGHTTFADVDARTSDLLIAEDTPRKVLADVQAFVADSAGLGRFAVVSPWGSKR